MEGPVGIRQEQPGEELRWQVEGRRVLFGPSLDWSARRQLHGMGVLREEAQAARLGVCLAEAALAELVQWALMKETQVKE